MAFLNFPTGILGPTTVEPLWPWFNTAIMISPSARSTQTAKLDSPIWRCSLRWELLDDIDRKELETFFLNLDGPNGRFYFGPAAYGVVRLGAGGGTPLVNGVSQLGSALITDGWPNNTLVLKKGDYISFDTPDARREMHMVMADLTSDGSGNGTISIKPNIRVSPADNVAVESASPTAIFRLMSDDQQKFSMFGPLLSSTTIELIEATVGVGT